MTSYYQARKYLDGWGFRTPTTQFTGFADRFSALKAAANQERADRHEAETGSGPISVVLQKHFFPNHTPAIP